MSLEDKVAQYERFKASVEALKKELTDMMEGARLTAEASRVDPSQGPMVQTMMLSVSRKINALLQRIEETNELAESCGIPQIWQNHPSA